MDMQRAPCKQQCYIYRNRFNLFLTVINKMKNLLLYSFLLILFTTCSTRFSEIAYNIKLIERYIEAVENKDHQTIELSLSDDYVGYGPSISDSTNRDEALSTYKYNIENLYQDIKYKRSKNFPVRIEYGPNKGYWVSSWAELIITYKDGRGPVNIWANTTYKIENRKIAKSYTVYNEADVLRQLGYVYVNLNDK